jgi:hypothetical protein
LKTLFFRVPMSLLLSISLVQCSSTPTKVSKATDIPASRIINLPTAEPIKAAKVTITRDAAFVGSGYYLDFKINGNLVAKIDQKEKLEFRIKAGKYVFSIDNESKSPSEIEVNLDANEEAYYRLTILPYNILRIQRSAEIN